MGPNGLTKEEIESSFQFKLIRKAIKIDYPFIRDIKVDADALNSFYTIFLKMIVDPEKLSEMFDNAPIQPWVYRSVEEKGYYDAIGLPLIIKTNDQQPLFDLQSEIGDLIRKVTESKAIPSEYILTNKSGNSVTFTKGDFIVA